MNINKEITLEEALDHIHEGMTLMVGGFGLSGVAERMLDGIVERGIGELKTISNSHSSAGFGAGKLIHSGLVREHTGSIVSPSTANCEYLKSGFTKLHLLPQGTLAEAIRAGGAGLGGFLTPVGLGTFVEEAKPIVEMDGKRYILERALTADVALVHAAKADRMGNLVLPRLTKNFCVAMCMAAGYAIAEADEIVETGEIDPDEVDVPGCCVSALVRSSKLPPRVREPRENEARDSIARRIAKLLKPGETVNLGVGIPTLIPKYLPDGCGVMFHTENGAIGNGEFLCDAAADNDCIDAGGVPVGLYKGASCFDSAMSFALVRGGHLDYTVLGAYQADQEGNIANWCVPGVRDTGMGGAMDLVYGAGAVIAALTQQDKAGNPKVLKRCSFPLTGAGCVKYIVTELATFEVADGHLVLLETEEGVSVEEVLAKTDADVVVPVAFS